MKGNKHSRWWLWAGVVVVVIAAVLYWRNAHQSPPESSQASAQQRPTAGGRKGMRGGALAPVQAAVATSQTVPRYLTGLGTITAANTVTVRSRVDGQLMALHFKEGQQVKAGDLLAEIDPSQFNVALAQAQGQLARDKATLANARRDLARYQQLSKTNLVSRQELDAQQALVSETAGTIKADEAAVASAQLQLNWSRITAPIDGRVGLKQVDIGNQISSGDTTGIVVLTQTHPIDLVFTLPESEIATVVQAQKAGQTLTVEAWDRTNKQKLSTGALLSFDNQIDATTGTIKLKARFENQDDALFPNQFVNARMLVAKEENAVVIPTAALQMGNEGNFVWVLNDKNQVSKHTVTTGIQDSEKVVITAGLSTGDRVVTDGIDRLTEGAHVEVVEPQAQASGEQKKAPATGSHAGPRSEASRTGAAS
ncbi:MdtA/MuxA family multidrug efflux RND transporter periplasmic adaptor subunit [Franconibacter pulveris 1160]|uniref:MdtA/MuxA family multidrug efflux RND transporter periplasmic adaptor subunit n=1 Tax=Franconibacter TaxID=1649295 RepID=UPI0004678124|nr:MdtA/MuxA family multidrug efflux RND transporter periplasmic adaptor subunit [Franconibacter pulveris]